MYFVAEFSLFLTTAWKSFMMVEFSPTRVSYWRCGQQLIHSFPWIKSTSREVVINLRKNENRVFHATHWLVWKAICRFTRYLTTVIYVEIKWWIKMSECQPNTFLLIHVQNHFNSTNVCCHNAKNISKHFAKWMLFELTKSVRV